MQEPNIVHVAGTVGTLLSVDISTMEVTQEPVSAIDDFHAIFSPEGQRLTAVGGNLFSIAGPYRGLAFSRDLGEME